jgi:uncharacterized protein (TIGR02453 family)
MGAHHTARALAIWYQLAMTLKKLALPDEDIPPFRGFADAQARFFRTLARKQDRDWFAAHKQEYEEGWRAPMLSLLHEVRARLLPSYPDCELGTPRLFRIHRDVRFSNDKSPFKTNVSGFVAARPRGPESPAETAAAFYFHVGTDMEIAAGQYSMGPEALARFRQALLDDERGEELAGVVAKLGRQGFEKTALEVLKKAPRGVDPQHPRAELLRHKGLIVSFPVFDSSLLLSPRLPALLAKQAEKAAPLVRWLVRLGR